MGDVTDFVSYRDQLRESITKEMDSAVIQCPKCGDSMFMVIRIDDVTDLDSGGPYAISCQHCLDPLGAAYLFDEDEKPE